MDLETVDPTRYPDWDSLLARSGDRSFFHSSHWANVLKNSYGYKPVYFASIEKDRLAFLMPLMEVSSLLTGKRGVSLPFTDQCPVHVLEKELIPEAVNMAKEFGRKAGWRHIEWRDAQYFDEDTPSSVVYFTHDIDLSKTEREMFSTLAESNRRCIRKACKEGVSVKISQALDSLKSFCHLNCLTRKRHGLPPQPYIFFQNVFDHVISNGSGIVVTASHSQKVIAAAIFFHYGDRAIYKYGASDIAYQRYRPNNLVMWEAIRWYKERALMTLNLGRTEPYHNGLLQYKRGWGATESPLRYFRYNFRKEGFVQEKQKKIGVLEKVSARIPVVILRAAGHIFYRHAG